MDMAKSQGAEYPVLADCSDKSKIIIQDTGGRGQTWIVELMEF
jgi:hypothetical protein